MPAKNFLNLTFGVEIECVVAYPAGLFGTGPKDVKIKREVEEFLDANGIPVNELRGDEPLTYDKWTVIEDTTIKKPPNTSIEDYDDMELVTRILYYDKPSSFEELRHVLRLVKSSFKLLAGPAYGCGLHVHIGNEDRGFPFEVLKRYALLVVAFERLLLSLVPAYRLDVPQGFKCFCHPPSTLIAFRGLGLEARIERVKTCEREWQLHDLMCPIWYGKNTAFNLDSHNDKTKQTIEHRLFPGTTDADEIIACVDLCAGLVTLAWLIPDAELDAVLEAALNDSYRSDHLFSVICKPYLSDCFGGTAARSASLAFHFPQPSRLYIEANLSPADSSPKSQRSSGSGRPKTEAWEVFSLAENEESDTEMVESREESWGPKPLRLPL
ncbi:MAG: hypothetical protein LQ340_005246 [Diploschistes diacapsis]|nr:MAG: hypothetical protein LQ340_005246 [Diploschistes diacapsis]